MNQKANPVDNSTKPWVENYPDLKGWLDRNKATCQEQIRHRVRNIETWLVHSHLVVIFIYANNRGWDIFTGIDDPGIVATLEDAAKRTGGVP